jgi:hypothetical protein
MAINNFDSDNVVFQTRDADTGGTWNTWVCNTTLNGNLASTVNELVTKCGTIQTPSNVTGTINFSGSLNYDPAAGEVSAKDVAGYANLKTVLEGRLVNLAAGTVALGEAILLKGDGRVTSYTVNADTGTAVAFDAVFSFSGAIDTDETDES